MTRRLISLSIAVFLVIPALVFAAYNDSISTAISAIEEIHSAGVAAVKAVAPASESEAFERQSAVSRDRAVKEIRSLRITGKPGLKRFKQVYRIVDSYAEGNIKSIAGMAQRATGPDRDRIKDAAGRLSVLKDAKLKALDATAKYETYEKEKPKPVPLVDRPPQERHPEEGTGIWDR